MTITIMDWLLDYATKVVSAHICIIVLSIYAPVGSWLPLAVFLFFFFSERGVIEEPFSRKKKKKEKGWRTAANCVPTVWVFWVCVSVESGAVRKCTKCCLIKREVFMPSKGRSSCMEVGRGGPNPRAEFTLRHWTPDPPRLNGPPGASLPKQVENEWIWKQGVCDKQHHAESFYKKKKKKVQKWRLHKNSSHPPQMMQAEPRANQWQDASLVPVLSKLYQHRFILPFELALDSEEKVTWSHFTSWKKIKIFISFADIPLLMICIFMTS